MPQISQSMVRNRLLAALPSDAFAHLARSLRPVSLELRQVLYAPGQPVEAAYFPEACTVSMLAPLESGDLVEVGMVGREGLVGLPVVLGAESSTTEALVQRPGTALHMPATALREAFDRSTSLRALLLRYVQAFHDQVTQTAACNVHHTLDERLARWLLMAHDRADSDTFPMTHEFMSMMLAVRRAGVTVAAGILQKAGVIRYAQGSMTIVDRPGLEAASCQCYGLIRRQFEHLLGQWGLSGAQKDRSGQPVQHSGMIGTIYHNL